jgi:hypothetical protein
MNANNPERFEMLVGSACQTATMPYRRLVDGVPSADSTPKAESESEVFRIYLHGVAAALAVT